MCPIFIVVQTSSSYTFSFTNESKLKYIVPYKFVHLWWAWRYKGASWSAAERRLLASGFLEETRKGETKSFDYEDAIDYLVEQQNDTDREKVTFGITPQQESRDKTGFVGS